MTDKPRFSRILVKLSGEALMGTGDYGIDPAVLRRIAGELQDILSMGVQVAVVIGGGNIFRGADLRVPAWTGSPPITWECLPRL